MRGRCGTWITGIKELCLTGIAPDLGPLWDPSGTILGPLRDHFGTTLGPVTLGHVVDGEPEVVVRDEEAVAARLQCEVLGERLRGIVVRLKRVNKMYRMTHPV